MVISTPFTLTQGIPLIYLSCQAQHNIPRRRERDDGDEERGHSDEAYPQYPSYVKRLHGRLITGIHASTVAPLDAVSHSRAYLL
jgi:hypothetical protein